MDRQLQEGEPVMYAKRLLIVMIAFICSLAWATQTEAAYLLPPPLEAQAAVLMDANSKEVLFEKNAGQRMYPASTTKIMTFLLAQKLGSPESIVTVSSSAAGCEGSSLEVSRGDRIKLRELLYGLMLVSGNDAAEAVAEHIAGSVPAFARRMNQEAVAIGARSTNFVNPHGLPNPKHYTTAHDLALITASAMKQPDFYKVTGTKTATIAFLNGNTRQIKNTNKLLGNYPGITGGKTGYTQAAGDCLVVTAKRGGVELIAVVLNDDERWEDAKNLFDFGFALKGVR